MSTQPSSHLPENFRRSRELFSFANFVFNNSTNVLDSSPLLRRAVVLLFQSLVDRSAPNTDAEPSTADPGESHELRALAERVRRMSDEHGIFAFRAWEHVDVLEQAERAFSEPAVTLTPQQLETYSELVARMPELYSAAARHLRGRVMPLDRRRLTAILRVLVPALLVASFAGWAFGPALYRMTFKEGIHASFYRGMNFEELVHERTDWSIDFDWGTGSLDPSIPADHFSARWKGVIKVPRDGMYTFLLRSDDGSRLFIDGKLVIDHWEPSNASIERSAEVPLRQGYIPVIVELFERDGGAAMHVAWKSSQIETAIVDPRYWAH